MKPIATGRLAQAASKYVEHAPMATACCNACRTCVQTNVLGLATVAAVATAGAARRFGRRLMPRTADSDGQMARPSLWPRAIAAIPAAMLVPM